MQDISNSVALGGGLLHAFRQPTFHFRPLGREDGIASGVAGDEIGGQPVGAQDSLQLAPDAFDGGAGTGVAHVGVETDAEHAPGFKGVGKK